MIDRKYLQVMVLIADEIGQKRDTFDDFTFDFEPQSTNYSTLRQHLAEILQIDSYFTISFKKDGQFVPLASDFDLDGAIFEASRPCLVLLIDLKPVDKTLEEWDIIAPSDIPPMEEELHTRCSEERWSLAGSFISHVETCVQKVHRCFTFDFNNNHTLGSRYPMSEDIFNSLMDPEGRITNARRLHLAAFSGGVEPSMRPVVWKHLLNVYPAGMTTRDRRAYLGSKCVEYYQLRYRWQRLVKAGTVPPILSDLISMVGKDARRTDRQLPFFRGSDDNPHTRALSNVLTTYALNHPDTSYVQGMSDMLSPILYVMRTEPHAYVCFCGLMRRLKRSFSKGGRAIELKHRHLKRVVEVFDKEMYDYLRNEGALDLVFCYRWLLLELKREFPYTEMLHLMEVMWGSLPPRPPDPELKLYKIKFPTPEIYQSLREHTAPGDRLHLDEDHFGGVSEEDGALPRPIVAAKIARWTHRVRRESIARNSKLDESSEDDIRLPVHYRKRKYRPYIAGKLGRLDHDVNANTIGDKLATRSYKIPDRKNRSSLDICQSWSCGETIGDEQKYGAALYDAREFLRNQWCYSNTINELQLNNWLNGRQTDIRSKCPTNKIVNSTRQRHGSNDSSYSTVTEDSDTDSRDSPTSSHRSRSEGYMSDAIVDDSDEDISDVDDEEETDSENEQKDTDYSHTSDRHQDQGQDMKEISLPPPHVLGDGNPFLLFLIVSMLQQHKSTIMKQKLDYNDLLSYFDKCKRKHKLHKVLPEAQRMFRQYLNMRWDAEDKIVYD
ncbi:hypothetical protein JTE90_012069 [Oedothorax gibbosus]|uniref:Rab-GAP TBC domain-containing protein n=1 Tax=Oedothorax gibbosus TaxID=931172 RepID=A0AAV6U6T0_9ARAC|nr:hypothetical protein JTE90_012069 [Oedothorax gibbosus]